MSTRFESSAWVEIGQDTTSLVFRLRGELDMASAAAVERAVTAAIASAGAITLDLRALTFCDSSGLRVLIAAQQQAATEGHSLTLTNVPAKVARLLDISGVDRVLTSIDGAGRTADHRRHRGRDH